VLNAGWYEEPTKPRVFLVWDYEGAWVMVATLAYKVGCGAAGMESILPLHSCSASVNQKHEVVMFSNIPKDQH
jgi:hypothetical protein